MVMSALETRLGGASKDKSVVIVGFEQGFKTTIALRAITERLHEGARVLYICTKTKEENLHLSLNADHLHAKTKGYLVISTNIKIDKILDSAERIRATTVVIDSLYDNPLSFTKYALAELVQEAQKRNIQLILTQPLNETRKQHIHKLVQANTAGYLVSDRLMKLMDATWLVYRTSEDSMHLRTIKTLGTYTAEDLRLNISTEALFN